MRIEDYLAVLSNCVKQRLDSARVIRGDKVDINQVNNEFGSIRMGLVLSNRLRKLTPIKQSIIRTRTESLEIAKNNLVDAMHEIEDAKLIRAKERELNSSLDRLLRLVDVSGPDVDGYLKFRRCEEWSEGLTCYGYNPTAPKWYQFKEKKLYPDDLAYFRSMQEYLRNIYDLWRGVDEIEEYSFFFVNAKFNQYRAMVQEYLDCYESDRTGEILHQAKQVEKVVAGLKVILSSSITQARPDTDKRDQYRTSVAEAQRDLDDAKSDEFWYQWLLEPISDGFVSKDVMELANYINYEHRKELLALLLIQDLDLEDKYADDYDLILNYVDNKVNSNYDQLCKLAQKDL